MVTPKSRLLNGKGQELRLESVSSVPCQAFIRSRRNCGVIMRMTARGRGLYHLEPWKSENPSWPRHGKLT